MEEKLLTIKFHRGVVYTVPTQIIAEDRAKYYAGIDGYELDSQEYLDEVNHALEDEFEIFDWVQNNMNWTDDLQPYAEQVEMSSIDLEDEWIEGNHTMFVK